jgi:hypothetical protein
MSVRATAKSNPTEYAHPAGTGGGVLNVLRSCYGYTAVDRSALSVEPLALEVDHSPKGLLPRAADGVQLSDGSADALYPASVMHTDGNLT